MAADSFQTLPTIIRPSSMQEILLYDPKRVPAGWMAVIRPGQYAAFLSDVDTSAPVSHDGTQMSSAGEYFCLMFDSLPEAQGYSTATADTRSSLELAGVCPDAYWLAVAS